MSQSDPPLRALLIGIDAYRAKSLKGSVNDIDAVQRLLIDRAGVPAERIRRLASPAPSTRHETSVPELPATLDNIRAALRELADHAEEGDRVLIYYSGHGARVPFAHPDGYTICREALVPADVDAGSPRRLLFDHELNGLLAKIARRTPSVTCILDCCHSAGVTRDPGLPGATSRSLDPVQHLGWIAPPPIAAEPVPVPVPVPVPGSGSTLDDGITRPFGDCHVVSACLDFELAMETPAEGGAWHGLLTHALLRALAGIPDPELHTVPWSRIWQAMRADVERKNPWQHLWVSGSLARAVLAGSFVDGDPGLPIRRAGDVYEIGAGTLVSVTESALLAVYGEQPPRLPPVDSDEDRAARRGLVRVTSASMERAYAAAFGPAFQLPPGARARVVEPGQAARLRCAIVPPNELIAATLRGSPWLELVDAPEAEVRLHQLGDHWLLADDVHDEALEHALTVLQPEELPHAREVLEQYYRYALPLRLARSVRGLPGALRLEVLSCEQRLSPAEAQDPDLPEAPTEGGSAYELWAGARVCFRVRNASNERLRVTLLNSAASGRVQALGNAVIDAGSAYVLWAPGELGVPFTMALPPHKQQGIDRLIAVGTTDLDADLAYLRVDRRFADILTRTPDRTRSQEKDFADPPGERWAAAQVIVKTRAE